MICPCGSREFSYDKKIRYCNKCGFILYKIKLYKIPPILRTPEERAISKIYHEILRVSSVLNFNKTNEVIHCWRKLFHSEFTSRRKRNVIIGALIYIIARRHNLPLFMDEIAYACNCTEKEIGRMQKLIARKLGIKTKTAKPEDFIPKFASKLNLPFKVVITAEKTCKKIKNHSYRTTAAISILIASKNLGFNLSYKNIQSATKVHKTTLIKLLKEQGVKA